MNIFTIGCLYQKMYATKGAPLKNYFLRLDYKKSKLEVKENEYF